MGTMSSSRICAAWESATSPPWRA
eukprot:SAG25_NODE_5761_length_623_cov_1.250000_1_plen_23_part_10